MLDDRALKLIKNLALSYEIALAIGTSLNLRDMLKHLLKTIVRQVGAYRGVVWVWYENALVMVTGVGFRAKGLDCCEVGDDLKDVLNSIMGSGQPLVITEYDHYFTSFCVPFTSNEKEILLVPVGNVALVQLAFTYKDTSIKELAGILTGVSTKLSNAILSCLNHEKMLAIERAEKQHSELRYQDLVNNLNVGIYISTIEGVFVDANPAFLKIFGFRDRQELYNYSWTSLYINSTETDNFIKTINEKGYVKNHQILFKHKDNKTFWAQVTAVIQYSRDGQAQSVMGIVEDITERKSVEDQLQYLATHDSLTNIPNRYFLEEALKQTVSRAKLGEMSALLIIDVDNFKLVNDTLGHAAGDELLINMSNLLKNNLRGEDLLARLGGDEFAVLLKGVNYDRVMVVAEKLRRVVEENEFFVGGQKQLINLSISIGVIMVDGAIDCQKLLSRADAALYQAKEGGRNRFVLTKPVDDGEIKFNEVNRLIRLIKKALKENGFVLFFQPVTLLRGGSINHYEVLVRLIDENGELIYPAKFIPMAERFGLMPQIDRWVVQSSLMTLREYPHSKLFVNLSGVSLGDEDLLEFVEESVGNGDIEPVRIGFEITETAAIKNIIQTKRWVSRLKKLGCPLALSDFGMGFSSFAYLHQLPVDYLKIDSSFVRKVDKDPTNYALVHAMNTVAHTLGKKTIAEFIENEEMLSTLCKLEIDYGQGFFLGKPKPRPKMEHL